MKRVIGLDLSIAATGVADGDVTSTLKMKPDDGDARLHKIRAAVWQLLANSGVDLVVIEDLPTHAKSAGITGMVHGVVRELLIGFGVPYALVVPSTLKKYATGKGNADKTAMAIAALKRFGLEFADDNRCDAYWLRAMGMDWLGEPLVELPALQRASLAVVKWPDLLYGEAAS